MILNIINYLDFVSSYFLMTFKVLETLGARTGNLLISASVNWQNCPTVVTPRSSKTFFNPSILLGFNIILVKILVMQQVT